MAGRIQTLREAATAMTRSGVGRRTVEWRWPLSPALLLGCAMPAVAASPLPSGDRPRADVGAVAATRTIVDHAVVPAGGPRCPQCPGGRCRHGQGHHRARGHHPDCRHGMCVPHCPVRPSEFGFYGTQWRRWPGQGVVPVSAEQAATPMAPPRSEVPGPDEESPQRPEDERSSASMDDPADASPAGDTERGEPRPLSPPEAPEPPDESAAGAD
jgi:hypothetical protein